MMDDIPGLFRLMADKAAQQGFVGGFPNFYFGESSGGVAGEVAGTILVKSTTAEWRDVFLAELGNPALNDVGARFRATQDWATHHGFIGGFLIFTTLTMGAESSVAQFSLNQTAHNGRMSC